MYRAAIDGRRLTFRLVGINNQNFVMQDEETGTWWQQVTGRGLFGPLAGRTLELVPHDEVSFAIWRADHPGGDVLAKDPEIEARGAYEPPDWETRMASTPTVGAVPTDSPYGARTLVVGIAANGSARAHSFDRLRDDVAILDTVGETPVVLVLAADGRSVRVFDRRVDGRALEFVATPGTPAPTLVDLETGSQWRFDGVAVSGPLAGRRLDRVEFLVDYWFNWLAYHPETSVERRSRPRVAPPDAAPTSPR